MCYSPVVVILHAHKHAVIHYHFTTTYRRQNLALTFIQYVSQWPCVKLPQVFNRNPLVCASFLIVTHFRKLTIFALLFCVFLSSRSRMQFLCNCIWRKTVGERQAVMWNKCCTRVCTKKSCVLTAYPCKPEQMVCGVSALGTGTIPRGVLAGLLTRWHLIPVLIFFYSWFFGLAYSRELGHGQSARACICGARPGWWEALGKNPNRDEDSLATTGHWDLLGIIDVSCGDSEGRVSQLFLSLLSFIGDPAWPRRTSG